MFIHENVFGDLDLKTLNENGKRYYITPAGEKYPSVTTILSNYKKEGIIKKFTLDLDKKKLGKNFLAIMLVSVDYKTLRELKKDQHKMAKEISFLPEVESVDVVTGGTDMVVRVRVKDVQEYDHFLLKKFQNLPGVDRTQSLVVIHER